MNELTIALALVVGAKTLVDALAAPIKQRYPDVDTWWLIYVAWLIGAILVWFTGVNLFDRYIYSILVGRIVTAVVVGGGASLVHDFVGNLSSKPGSDLLNQLAKIRDELLFVQSANRDLQESINELHTKSKEGGVQ